MIITSLITIMTIGASDFQNQPTTLGIYDHRYQPKAIEFKTDADLPSVVAWKEMSRKLGIELPIRRAIESSSLVNAVLLQAFHRIELPDAEGLSLLTKAQEILVAASYPCTSV